MTETPRTPGKWRVVGSEGVDVQSGPIGGLAYVSTAGARGRTLAEARANAREIVRALNSHDPLLRAAEVAAAVGTCRQCQQLKNQLGVDAIMAAFGVKSVDELIQLACDAAAAAVDYAKTAHDPVPDRVSVVESSP